MPAAWTTLGDALALALERLAELSGAAARGLDAGRRQLAAPGPAP
jgi:hypothetical protein